MKSFLCVCLLVLLCGVFAKNKKDDNKVKIAVYYESLCPDSKRFITTQLAPVWRDFRGVVKVKLVPYGKSTHDKVDGKWQFTCHHGPDECYGNKMQACILKDRSLLDTDKMELVICLMSQTSPDKSLDTCLDQVNKRTESDKLKRCASGEQGGNLLASYGDKTDSVQRPLGFVPTIVINEDVSPRVFDETPAPVAIESVVTLMPTSTGQECCHVVVVNKTPGIVYNSRTKYPRYSPGESHYCSHKFDQATQNEAFTDLKTVVCRSATTKPSVC